MRVAYRFAQWAFPDPDKIKDWAIRNRPEDKVEWTLISILAVAAVLEVVCVSALIYGLFMLLTS